MNLLNRLPALALALLVINSCSKEEENLPPTCSIINPISNAKIAYNESFTISVNASDIDGEIASVNLFINNKDFGIKNSSPYSFEIAAGDIEIGSVSAKVVVTDNANSSAECNIDFEIVALSPEIRINEIVSVDTTSVTIE